MINDKDAVQIHKVESVEGVEVSLYTDEAERRCLRIRVMGAVAFRLGASTHIVDAGHHTMKDLTKKVAVAAGACAEHLAERYREPLEPDEVARRGVEALRRLLNQS